MKAYIIQPPYSRDAADADRLFAEKLRLLEACPPQADLILLPEYSDVPVAASTREETLALHGRFFAPLMEACAQAARRCRALVFVNALSEEETGLRNTTFCLDREGRVIGKYFKRHLPPLEEKTLSLDGAYTYEPREPYVLDAEGVRYAFLTCYDFYFYEAFAAIARRDVDVIIGCSLQRSDTHDAIEIMCRFLAYNTNAYVLRSSVSFAEDSTVCGASMAVSPGGEVLCNLGGRFGAQLVEFDPKDKYLKPAGYGNPPSAHYQYIEYGRKPWQYRPAGSAIVPGEARMPYPRLCAHRGFSAIAPENSLPAYGAAVALGAQEIEFDLWPTLDGEIVSCHDSTLDRISDGTGKIFEHTLAQLQQLDFGAKFGPEFQGLRIVRFEDILRRFSCHTVMNIHVKTLSDHYDGAAMERIVSLIRRYDCAGHCYFMITHDGVIRKFKAYAPDIPVCVGHLSERPWAIVDRAIELGAQKVQLFKPYFNQEMIDKAHAHGIRCNVFWADEPEEARKYLDMGIDTVLTNRYQRIADALGF